LPFPIFSVFFHFSFSHLDLVSAGAAPRLHLVSRPASASRRAHIPSSMPRAPQSGLPLHLDTPRAAAVRPSPPPRRATARRRPAPPLPPATDCYCRGCHPRACAGKRRRSRMEPRKRGSTSPLKAARGSIAGSTPGAGAISTVWQGSGRSRSWSCSWSPIKQGLNMTFQVINFGKMID
jgi:hypothetical protein